MMPIAVFCQLLMLPGDAILLGEFELGDKVLDIYGMETKFEG